MIFSSLSKRERLIFIFTFIFITLALLYCNAAEPLIKKWINLDRQIAIAELKLQKDLKLLSKSEEVNSLYKKYAFLKSTSLSDEQQMAALLSEIEEIARTAGVHINSLKPKTMKETSLYEKFAVEAELSASMVKLINFFYNLQSSQKILKAESMQISAKRNEPGSVKCRVIISSLLFQK